MRVGKKNTKKQTRQFVIMGVAAVVVFVLGGAAAYLWAPKKSTSNQSTQNQSQTTPLQQEQPGAAVRSDNPLSNKKFYIDGSRTVAKQAVAYEQSGNPADAALLRRIADRPGTTWLTGSSPSDPTAENDIKTVQRTSAEAAAQGTVPVYQLYAMPNRDACAAYSKGGWANAAEYSAWVDRIIGALKAPAVFVVEADAIAHTINARCLKAAQVAERYALLKQTVQKLSGSPNAMAVYLDAAHPDWMPDPSLLVAPLREAGVEYARGVAVNVSFFMDTPTVTKWSQQLVTQLGGNKGVMIDTSRNGKGVHAATGDARWCNPPGRGIGLPPTTLVQDANIDAYFWGKNIGESDGACFGYPAAGTFVPALALEMARNAQQ